MRGGVSFGAEFPVPRDDQGELDPELLRDPGFSSLKDLAPGSMDRSTGTASHHPQSWNNNDVEGLPVLGFLSQPMIFEVGATMSTSYLPVVFFNVDIVISTEGAILIVGSMEVGVGDASFVAGEVKFLAICVRFEMAMSACCSWLIFRRSHDCSL